MSRQGRKSQLALKLACSMFPCCHVLSINVSVTIINPPKDRFEREIRPTVKKEGVSIIISSSPLFSFFSSSCLYKCISSIE